MNRMMPPGHGQMASRLFAPLCSTSALPTGRVLNISRREGVRGYARRRPRMPGVQTPSLFRAAECKLFRQLGRSLAASSPP